MLGFLGNFTSGGLNIGGNILSMMTRLAVRAVGALAGALWGGLRALFSTAVRIVGGGFDLLKTLFRKAFDGIVALGKVVLVGFAAALGGTVVAVQKSIEKLKAAGNSISDIRGATGLGSSRAGGIWRNMTAFGLPANMADTNPYAMAGQAAAWGLPGMGSRNFTSSLAGKYQSSDPFMQRYMLQSMNIDSPEMRRRLMTPAGMLREQERFTGQVHNNLGIDPGVIESLTQRTELLGLKFKVLGEGILLKLATEVLPRLLNVGERVAKVLGDNSDKIGTFIENAVNQAFAALVRFGEFILRLPPMFFGLADSVLSFVETALGAIPSVWDAFLQGVALVQSVLEQLMAFGQNVFGGLMNFGQTLLALGPQLQPIYDGVLNFLNNLSKDPTVQRFLRAGKALPGVLKTASEVANTSQEVLENGAKGLGADENTASLLSLAGTYFLGRGILGGAGNLAKWGLGKAGGWALGKLGLGGANAATSAATKGVGNVFSNMMGGAGRSAATNPGLWARIAGGAQGAWSSLTGLPALAGTSLAGAGAATIAGVTGAGLAAGTAAGYGLHWLGQKTGALRGDKTFVDDLKHGYGVIADLVTGNQGHTQAMYHKRIFDSIQAERAAQAPGLGDTVNAAVKNAAAKGRAAASALPGLMPTFNMNPASSTWATAIDQKFGPQVRDFSDNGLKEIAAMRARLDSARGNYNAEEHIKLLRELLGETKKQTPLMKDTAEGVGTMGDRVAADALRKYAKESGMAMRRQGA